MEILDLIVWGGIIIMGIIMLLAILIPEKEKKKEIYVSELPSYYKEEKYDKKHIGFIYSEPELTRFKNKPIDFNDESFYIPKETKLKLYGSEDGNNHNKVIIGHYIIHR